MNKFKKTKVVAVRINEQQYHALHVLINNGKAQSISGAIQYLISQHIILGN